jgi:dihydroneopterin aldolase
MDEITLRGMRFHALVGILPHERTVPQPLEVDLTVCLDPGTGVVDYTKLYEAAARIVSAGHNNYLEEIGERIANEALTAHARVRIVRVAVRKPQVALPGPLAYAEITIERTCGD